MEQALILLAKKLALDLLDKEKRTRLINTVIVIIATIFIVVVGFITFILTSPFMAILNILGVDVSPNVIKDLQDFRVENGVIDIENRTIPLYIQTDSEWSDYPYANSNVGISGCGPTSLAMVVSGLTENEVTPIEMAQYSTDNGYAVDGIGTSWGLMTRGATDFGLDAEQVSFSEESIIQNLSQGKIMITSMKKGTFTDSGHFIVLIGISENGQVIVNDSYSREMSSKSFSPSLIANESKGAWAYSLKFDFEEGNGAILD